MNSYQAILSLLGQAVDETVAQQPNPAAGGISTLAIISIVVVAVILLFILGGLVAKSVRMPDYGWKIGIILVTVVSAATVNYFRWPPSLGIDLEGGVILVYQVNEQDQDEEVPIDINELVRALKERVNPGGVREVVIRAYGEKQVEFIIPDIGPAEIERIKKMIVKAGFLEFRIVAERQFDADLVTQAETENELAQRQRKNPPRRLFQDDQLVGEWVKAAIDKEKTKPGNIVYKIDVENPQFVTREAKTGEVEILLAVDDFNVEGIHLRSAASDYDQSLAPCIRFSMTGRGAALFGGLTSTNEQRKLGIVMDKQLLSAPTIQETITSVGQITGRFNQEEVDVMVGVLKAGRLPAALQEEPISENMVSSLLGADTIRSGTQAITVALISVLIFMVFYYRFSGIVACMALLTNLLLILAIMIFFQAAFTLPGLAGLVLTVGMSVDANVLIFERIREELRKGAALRMAIRNGYGRATTTIVDANVTTLITAIVLYVIGTDQVRGFAVTLILGILMSMYTAIFCSRVLFDIAERRRWISNLSMMQLLGKTRIDFVGKRKLAAVCSLVLITIGLCGAVYRGKGMFDIDFNGGTSAQILLNTDQPMPIEDVRKMLTENLSQYDPSVFEVEMVKRPRNTTFKIDTSITGEFEWDKNNPPTGRATNGADLIVNYLLELFADNGGQATWQASDTFQLDFETPVNATTVSGILRRSIYDLKPEVTEVTTGDVPAGSRYRVTLSLSGVGILQTELKRVFGDRLERHTLEVDPVEAVTAITPESPADEPDTGSVNHPIPSPEEPSSEETTRDPVEDQTPSKQDRQPNTEDAAAPAPSDPEPATEAGSESPASESDSDPRKAAPRPPQPTLPGDGARIDLPPASWLAFAGGDLDLLAQLEGEDAAVNESTSGEVPSTSDAPSPDGASEEGGQSSESDVEQAPLVARQFSQSQLKFTHPINEETLQFLFDEATQQSIYREIEVEDITSSDGQNTVWNVTLSADPIQSTSLLNDIQSQFNQRPVWLSSNNFGGKVASDTRNQAIAALLTSLIGIVAYIWIRFQRVMFGLAAVVALVHDVLVTLGFLALSLWLADIFGFLLITEFKINLPIVAAFLTIIGYSLNDTIVVFDRIREVRGKSPNLTGSMINTSINQTLSRTLLTSATTLIVVLILYGAGGESIHGFAFALVVGILAGTYSSMFVASPVLLWMSQTEKPAGRKQETAATAS